MALFGNKKIQVPEIPNNPGPTAFSQTSMQKQPINEYPKEGQNQYKPSIPEPKPVLQEKTPSIMQTSGAVFPEKTQRLKIPEVTTELNFQKTGSFENKEQPFFVRIDKFNETKENFENVNEKVAQMEQILENLEKIKQEEDNELEAWKEEVNEMKSYLDSIDKEIFSKI